MKRNFRLLWAALALTAAPSAPALAAPEPVTLLRGSLQTREAKMEKIFLYDAAEGRHRELASARIDNRRFAFAVQSLPEGFYYVGDQARRRFHRLYLKPGEQLDLRLNDSALVQQNPSPEGKVLAEWEKRYNEIRVPAFEFARVNVDYTTFFPLFTRFLPKAEQFKSTIKTPNKAFNSWMKMLVDADVEAAALCFLYTPRGKHPAKNDYPAYYQTIIQNDKFCDSRFLRLGETEMHVNNYILFASLNGTNPPSKEERLAWSLRQICNDTLKGALLVNSISRYNALDQLLAAVSPLKQHLVTASQREAYEATEKKLRTFKTGEPGYNFNYPDISGKPFTLADLKGKVVVVDMWATWCGPCKAEIPHLKKLEADMHGKDVVFVSVSVDEEKDKEKWESFVKKESLGGVQLFASGWSGMAKFYGVNAIPRFMVFDKSGKIVTIDAPRPSQPALAELIHKTLQ